MSRKNIKHALLYIIILFFWAIEYNLLVRPINLVTGGSGGVAIILEEIFDFNPSITIFVIDAILFVFCIICLKKDDIIAAAIVTIIYPIFINSTLDISNIININYTDKLVITLLAGTINGIMTGLVYKIDYHPGGLSIIYKIIHKAYNISVTSISLVVNTIIVISGCFLFGFDLALYAIIYLFLTKIISDKIILGTSENKVFHIVTDKYKEIKKLLSKELTIDSTIYNIKDNDKKFLMIVVPSKDYYLVKELIKEIDQDVFFFISDGYEVKGANRKLRKEIYLDE